MNNTKPLPTENQTLRDGWIDFLSRYNYDWFATFTFDMKMIPKGEIHPDQADRLFRRWLRLQNELYFGTRFRDKGVGLYCFRALEHQLSGVIHYHALIAGIPHYQDQPAERQKHLRMQAENMWLHLTVNDDEGNELKTPTGFCSIFPYRPTRGAARYMTKYISKGGDIEAFMPRLPYNGQYTMQLNRLPQDRPAATFPLGAPPA